MTFAVLAEDRSDVDALVVLVKRISNRANATVYRKGFSGCGELLNKASSHILDFALQGATHFIICHDSDGNDPENIRQAVRKAILPKLNLSDYTHGIIVPVQELEAWMIADEEAIKRVIPSLDIKPVLQPESVKSPKEWLISESRKGRSRPLYAPATYNARVAEQLDVDKVKKKCRSFAELVDFISQA